MHFCRLSSEDSFITLHNFNQIDENSPQRLKTLRVTRRSMGLEINSEITTALMTVHNILHNLNNHEAREQRTKKGIKFRET